MKLAQPQAPSGASSIESALEQLERAHDGLLGLGNLSECFANCHSTLQGKEDEVLGAPAHTGTPWGVKASQGQRPNMEDAYSVQLAQPSLQAMQQLLPSGSMPPVANSNSPGPDSSTDAASLPVADVNNFENGEDNTIPWMEDLAVLSVFDGHGGQEVAMHCRDRLHKHFATTLSSKCLAASNQQEEGASIDSNNNNLVSCNAPCQASSSRAYSPEHVGEALRVAFYKTDQELAGTEAGDFVGATAVVAVVGRQHIWIAHCGDSRAVLQKAGDAQALTRDHKPDREDEAARIKAAGGRVVYASGSHRVMGMLAMSRAIGDHFLRPYVIADPEVAVHERSPQDEVLVLATDGLWDVFSCKEATTLAQRCITRSKERGMTRHGACRVAASVLTKVALERGSRDNITVIVVDVTMQPASTLPAPHSQGSFVQPSVADDVSSTLKPHASEGDVLHGRSSAKQSGSRETTAEDAETIAHSVTSSDRNNASNKTSSASTSTVKISSSGNGASPSQASAAAGNGANSAAPAATPTNSLPTERTSQQRRVSTTAEKISDADAAASQFEKLAIQHQQQQQKEGLGSQQNSGRNGAEGMGSRKQSFSVSTCTLLKSQSTLSSAGPSGSQAQAANKSEEDPARRIVARQSSAPSNSPRAAVADAVTGVTSQQSGDASVTQTNGNKQGQGQTQSQLQGNESSSPQQSTMPQDAGYMLANGRLASEPILNEPTETAQSLSSISEGVPTVHKESSPSHSLSSSSTQHDSDSTQRAQTAQQVGTQPVAKSQTTANLQQTDINKQQVNAVQHPHQQPGTIREPTMVDTVKTPHSQHESTARKVRVHVKRPSSSSGQATKESTTETASHPPPVVAAKQ